ncbi:MAG: hypothetical protein LBE24_01505 [Methylobacillus sp.]|jgi:hypothetical protein|nr:hypothetical protein [Methylobacillus sp.]
MERDNDVYEREVAKLKQEFALTGKVKVRAGFFQPLLTIHHDGIKVPEHGLIPWDEIKSFALRTIGDAYMGTSYVLDILAPKISEQSDKAGLYGCDGHFIFVRTSKGFLAQVAHRLCADLWSEKTGCRNPNVIFSSDKTLVARFLEALKQKDAFGMALAREDMLIMTLESMGKREDAEYFRKWRDLLSKLDQLGKQAHNNPDLVDQLGKESERIMKEFERNNPPIPRSLPPVGRFGQTLWVVGAVIIIIFLALRFTTIFMR